MRRFLLAVCLLAGCGSDSGGSIDADELPGALNNAICDLYVRCGLIDADVCGSLDLDVNVDRDLLAAVDAGLVTYHGDKAQACLASLRANECTQRDILRFNEACDGVFEGTLHAGSVCALDEVCISQECDIPSCPDACCKGTCVGDVPPVRPHVTESCETTTRCIDSYCDISSRICMPYRATGQPCTDDFQCAEGACAGTTCATLPGPNQACVPSVGCNDLGYYCSSTSMTCVPSSLMGDPCTPNGRECSELYSCGSAGTCQLGPRLGEMCTGDCIDSSYCDMTTNLCTAPKADGAACTSNSQCVGDCDVTAGLCVTPPICI